MSRTVIQVEGLGKRFRIGQVTGQESGTWYEPVRVSV